jgi:hypothetical protein
MPSIRINETKLTTSLTGRRIKEMDE